MGILELISKFDQTLNEQIEKCGNPGSGNASYLSKTTCEEFIKKTLAQVIHEINNAGNFSVSVDSTPDMSHVDQFAVIVTYVLDGKPTELFLTFIDIHTPVPTLLQLYFAFFRKMASIFGNVEGRRMTTPAI